jgi:hypothetical protein
MSNISVGDRIRWKPRGEKQGLIGHEGTVIQLDSAINNVWCWVLYDDGTEKDAYLSELEKIES